MFSCGTFSPPARKRASQSIPPPNLVSTSSTSDPDCAARRFIQVPELRQHLLSLLSPHDLAISMRVRQGYMYDVASILYHTVPYNQVRLRMSIQTPRQRMYCSAVRIIDATSMTLSSAMLHDLGAPVLENAEPEQVHAWLRTYRPEVINLIVPHLRAKCNSLRTIRLGSAYEPFGHDSWEVHFRPAQKSDKPWHVEHIYAIRYDTSRPVPSRWSPTVPAAPSPEYAVRSRFDLKLSSAHGPIHESWTGAFSNGKSCSSLCRSIDFGEVEVSLPTITALYKWQSSAEHMDRLGIIIAINVPTISRVDFGKFARAASASLTHLDLAGGSGERMITVSAKDLTFLVSKTSKYLPNLQLLAISTDVISRAASACQKKMRRHHLDSPGSVKELSIRTTVEPKRLLRVIRFLARICHPDADLHIGRSVRGRPRDDGEEQTGYLRFLLSQGIYRRRHLAVADLVHLGVTSYKEALALEFHPNGEPLRRCESYAARFAEQALQAQQAVGLVSDTILPHLEASLRRLAAEAERFKERSETATQAEIEAGAEMLWVAAVDMGRSSEPLKGVLKATDRLGLGITRYAGSQSLFTHSAR